MTDTRQAKANRINRIALGVLIILVSLFCFLCVLGAFGGVGDMVYGFLVGFFGLADYAYCLIGIILGVAITFNLRPRMRFGRAALYFGLLALGIYALQIYTSSGYVLNSDYGSYLLLCYNNTNTAGGMLFGITSYPLMQLTSVGALVIACAAFFALAFVAIFPAIKKNVVYTANSPKERGMSIKAPKARLFAKKDKAEDGHGIDAQSTPTLTDLSRPAEDGGNLFVVEVDGDPLQKKKKRGLKGAEGYNPLYPNANGGYEDEQKIQRKNNSPDKFSARGMARNILFGDEPTSDALSSFNGAVNPSAPLSSVGAPYSELRRTELQNRLGLDSSETVRQSFISRYRAENRQDNIIPRKDRSSAIETEAAKLPEQTSPFEKNEISGAAVSAVKADDSEPKDYKNEFVNLKQEQIRRFNEMFSTVKPEFEATAYKTADDAGNAVQAENIKKEIVKPTRILPHFDQGDAINPTIDKAESAVNNASTLAGLQGSVSRAMNGESAAAPKRKTEIVSDGYDVAENKRDVAKNDVFEAGQSSPNGGDGRRELIANTENTIKSGAEGPKMPRAFEDSAIDQTNKSVPPWTERVKRYEMGETPGKKVADKFGSGAPESLENAGERPVAPAPRVQPVTGESMSRTSIQSATQIAAQSAREVENAEIKARIENIKKAGKEAPALSAYEREAALQEQKMRAAESRGLQRSEKREKKPQETKIAQERVTQVNIDQAIAQVTPKRPYIAPPISLLNPPAPPVSQDEDYEQKKKALIDTLAFFGVQSSVKSIMVGPTFSMYTLEVEMPRGRSVSYLEGLESDIAMKMEEESVRIIAPIPGQNAVGIEVPNKHRRTVTLSEIMNGAAFNNMKSPATFAIGKNLYGNDFSSEVRTLPHMLIAGATGAGKSCCINSVIVSMLYKASPDDVRFIMVDPKRVELSIYEGIPHLLMDEIICDVDKAIRALNWAITEMTRRMDFLAKVQFRDIDEYNADCEKLGYDKMPRIVIIIDEFADLMSIGKKAVEDSINRIARLSRAVGIHLILATQRPSVDVVSGTIKNNLPSRIAFKVTSSFDSKTVLDSVGAEKLLGYGDLLYKTPKSDMFERMQGAFISNEEVKRVVDFIKENNESYFDNNIKDAIFKEKEEEREKDRIDGDSAKGNKSLPPELFDALSLGIALGDKPIAISYMQRKLGLGWPKAAKIYDMMDDMGYLSAIDGKGDKKRVNITEDELDALMNSDDETEE